MFVRVLSFPFLFSSFLITCLAFCHGFSAQAEDPQYDPLAPATVAEE